MPLSEAYAKNHKLHFPSEIPDFPKVLGVPHDVSAAHQRKILNRPKEMTAVSTKVLQPERSHWLHDIPISNKTLLLTG